MASPNHFQRRRSSSASEAMFVVTAIIITFTTDSTTAAYRQFHVDNADICNTGKLVKTKTLQLGTGAALLQLSSPSTSFQPNYRNKAKRCEIHIRAPADHGLLAYVEEMNMRRSSRDGSCVDYVQFGLDDLIPFLTYEKSDRLCGERDGKTRVSGGFAYDDPHGNLLVWVSLGGRRQTSAWPQISVVNLTLVVTSYQKNCGRPRQNFMRCGARDKCIWKHYFCDRHINCAQDVIPADEEGCEYDARGGLQHTTLSPGGGGDGDGSGGLNVISTVILVVASVVATLISFILVVKYRRRGKCCGHAGAASADCPGDFEHPRSIDALSRGCTRQQVEENLYLPLRAAPAPAPAPVPVTLSHDQELVVTTNLSHGPGLGMPTGEEPPPAYDDLFPEAPRPQQHQRRSEESISENNNGADSEDWETEEETTTVAR